MTRALPQAPFATRCQAWNALEGHARRLAGIPLDTLLDDPARAGRFTVEAEGLMLDLTRQRLDADALAALVELAAEAGVADWIRAMLEGAEVNPTEGRPALHTALRRAHDAPLAVDGHDVMSEVAALHAQMRGFVDGVLEGTRRGWTGRAITDVVNIGIGGSDLGIVMAVEALTDYRSHLRTHFVSNVDGAQAADVMRSVDPETTLFVVCSKSFGTQETLANAQALRAWLHERGGDAAVAAQFVAVSTNARAMDEFGIDPALRFTMWDWVGGRYSLWSSVGLVIALAVGWRHFDALLAGGRAMDAHFASAPLAENLPVLLALVGAWNQNLLGASNQVVLPYDQRLHRLPAFLQQLEMESNGKSVTRDGEAVAWPTGAIVWGEPGSNAQHSFYQLLHQGTRGFHADFIAPARGSGPAEQHRLALANMLAQAEAFARGHGADAVRAELEARGLDALEVERLLPHKLHAGGRPSTLVLFERLDPGMLGRLVALYEHKVFVQSVLWGINAFDQWGVELGKKLAGDAERWLAGDEGGDEAGDLAGDVPAAARWLRARGG